MFPGGEVVFKNKEGSTPGNLSHFSTRLRRSPAILYRRLSYSQYMKFMVHITCTRAKINGYDSVIEQTILNALYYHGNNTVKSKKKKQSKSASAAVT